MGRRRCEVWRRPKCYYRLDFVDVRLVFVCIIIIIVCHRFLDFVFVYWTCTLMVICVDLLAMHYVCMLVAF